MLRICYPQKMNDSSSKDVEKTDDSTLKSGNPRTPTEDVDWNGKIIERNRRKWRVHLGNVMIQKLKKAQKVVPHSMKH